MPEYYQYTAPPDEVLRRFLKEVEASGFGIDKVDVQNCVLKKDYEQGNSLFGSPGSKKRKDLLRKFYQLRRNSLENYSKSSKCRGIFAPL